VYVSIWRTIRAEMRGILVRPVFCGLAAATFCLVPLVAQAQTPLAPQDVSVGILADGWAALAAGDLAKAGVAARQAVADDPRSAGPLALLVEVEIARAGAMAGLTAYEQWLGSRKLEAVFELRRIASAFLLHVSRQPNAAARQDAFKALVTDGHPAATASLKAAAPGGGIAEARLLATLGDERAVRALIAELQAPRNRDATIKALLESRSELAVEPLVKLLTEGSDDDRIAAADALGRLGAEEAVSALKPLLNSQNFGVRLKAAGALYRLRDNSGALLLDQLLTSEHGGVRLGAAEALSVRPGGAWLNVARALTSDPDQAIQLAAARLVAPYDRELAESVVSRLSGAENLAIREEAGRILADHIATDFTTLRRLLRSQDERAAVRAAGRILELTR
jgi:HEAT repeat protein